MYIQKNKNIKNKKQDILLHIFFATLGLANK